MKELNSPWAELETETLHRVTSPEQAAILVNPVRSRFLHPFLGRDCTVSDAASQLGVSVNTMLYRVRRMVARDLLEVVRVVPRPGRAVKVYRSKHTGYLVPVDAMRYDDLRHRVDAQGRVLAQQLARDYTDVLTNAPADGVRILARNAAGDVWTTDLAPAANHRGQPVHFSDVTVQLTREEATELRQLLLHATTRALDHNRTAPTTHSDPYLIVTAILPTTG
ncbi:MAG: helix-turn-helix domain-containing protein [Propionibacteriaceae bacterium]|nr:helix-turn-helix domain-containing protein [Propionibacteriaceae bacterium]